MNEYYELLRECAYYHYIWIFLFMCLFLCWFLCRKRIPEYSYVYTPEIPSPPESCKVTQTLSSDIKPNIPVVKTWSSTYTEERKGVFEWTIHNFTQRIEKNGESLISPTFSSGTDDKFKWCLKLYPRGVNEDNEGFLSLFLKIVPQSQNEAHAKSKFSILNAKRKETNVRSIPDNLFLHYINTTGKFNIWGCKKFIHFGILFTNAEELLPDDKLTISCEVVTVVNNIHVSAQLNTSEIKVPDCDLSDDFKQLFENQTLCDVTFIVSGEKFQAHKTVLAARSPVFKAMFEHDMKEKKSNQVDLIDVDQEVFQEMLRFVYTGKVLHLEKIAFDLLAIADKYALERLKTICEEKLCANLSIESAAKILLFSNLHKANQMKAVVVDFINSYAIDVIRTSDWKSVVKEHPDIVVDLYKASATSLKVSKMTSSDKD